jgi:phosphoglucosamine mutase
MARQLFGTDGIRGVAGQYPLDAPTVFAFGQALGAWAAETARTHGVERPEVVIGMDTRESGPWLADYVAGGLARHSVGVHFAGVTTTPGVAYLTRSEDFVAGVMISASHNPYHDNGLKVFDHSGFKLPDAEEHRMEQVIFEALGNGVEAAPQKLSIDPSLDRHYLEFLASTFHGRLDGFRIVVDAAHGAAYEIAPALFERLGAAVIRTGCSPDGRNINKDCGALHTGHLREAVLAHHADAGAAFDGDADRCMLISARGKLIDGDHALLIAAQWLARIGRPPAAIVATVMSNLGLERALAALGIRLLRTSVGDKYVLEEMVRSNLPVGGEQSGHVIFRDFATTGDGLLTALRVLEESRATGRSFEELTAGFTVYPQRLVNVRFKEKRPLEELASVQKEIAATEEAFGDAGRVLVRFSGTEPLARVMVEGPDLERVELHAGRIAKAIAAELGAA